MTTQQNNDAPAPHRGQPTLRQPPFLPMTRQEMDRLGWKELDVLLVTGDAYVDHPSFGSALLGRWLVAHGYRVGIVAQPQWEHSRDVERMGRPRLFAGVTAGAIDSMLAHYTAFRKKRNDDAYTPGGLAGARPNRATIVYTGLVKHAFPGLPIVLGGIEASLRRITHYDFWTDKLRRSVLLDAKADCILYGTAERGILEVAKFYGAQTQDAPRALAEGDSYIPGAAYVGKRENIPADAPVMTLPSHEEMLANPAKLMEATLAMEQQVHRGNAWAVQASEGRTLILTPPGEPMSTGQLDALYALPFTRKAHPSYAQPVPAEEMIRFSVTSHRGCAGGCSFCSLALHQGRRIRSRSEQSIAGEISRLTQDSRWTGSISDVGGPSANMWDARCEADPSQCKRASCLHPFICTHFKVNQSAMIGLLKTIKKDPKIKHIRIASGVRFDLALREPQYVAALVREFVGGQLKIAPEHVSEPVVRLMRKPEVSVFEKFVRMFEQESQHAGKQQFIVPYLMSAFPGCTEQDMRNLATWLKNRGWRPEQVQCFIPTPGTVATAMYYAAIDPQGRPMNVARSDADRLRLHHILITPGQKPLRGAGRPSHTQRPDQRRRGR